MANEIEYKLDNNSNNVDAYLGDRKVGELNFIVKSPTVIVITRTWTDEEFRGKGIGAALVRYIAEYARKHEKKIIPQCSFAVAFFKNKPEFQDVEYKE